MNAMTGLKAIYSKEILSYFRSPIAYFVIAVFLLGTGYFFTYNIFLTGVGTMDSTLQNMGILLLIIAPVLTMRIFSAEYNARTMELLMTLPVQTWQVVLGKYLGAVTIFLLMTLATCINLVPLYLYGNPQTLNIISGYIGFILLGMTCIAIGQFFSALTENQIVAALITIPVLLGFWFVGHLQQLQSSMMLRDLVAHLSFALHFADFIRGLLRSDGVVFFLAVIASALTLNTSYLQLRR
jgi:ABC-2 type transport system permease protein